MLDAVEQIRRDPEAAKKNRQGVLLCHKKFRDTTKTLSHTLWALFNVLPAHTVQARHWPYGPATQLPTLPLCC